MGALLQKLRRMNPVLFVSMVALIVIGVLFIYSAGSVRPTEGLRNAYRAQAGTAALGLGLYLACALVDYRKVLDWFAWPGYAAALVLLVTVLLAGSEIYGGKRWLWFFQPSEAAKFAVILLMADLFGRRGAWRGPAGLAAGLALLGVPAALILVEPDLGTTLVLVPTVLAMLLAARVWTKGLVVLLAAGALAASFMLGAVYVAEKQPTPERKAKVLALTHLEPHQVRRLQVFLFPDSDIHGSGYNRRQAEISVGSGGFRGKGFLKGEQYLLGYLPPSVSMNDFIFAVLAEEAGFVGTMLVLVLYLGILIPGLWIGLKCVDDRGRLVSVGVTMLIFCHVYINMAMSIGLMPITGLPLPFISNGRTFLVVLMAALGIVQSVAVHGRDPETRFERS